MTRRLNGAIIIALLSMSFFSTSAHCSEVSDLTRVGENIKKTVDKANALEKNYNEIISKGNNTLQYLEGRREEITEINDLIQELIRSINRFSPINIDYDENIIDDSRFEIELTLSQKSLFEYSVVFEKIFHKINTLLSHKEVMQKELGAELWSQTELFCHTVINDLFKIQDALTNRVGTAQKNIDVLISNRSSWLLKTGTMQQREESLSLKLIFELGRFKSIFDILKKNFDTSISQNEFESAKKIRNASLWLKNVYLSYTGIIPLENYEVKKEAEKIRRSIQASLLEMNTTWDNKNSNTKISAHYGNTLSTLILSFIFSAQNDSIPEEKIGKDPDLMNLDIPTPTQKNTPPISSATPSQKQISTPPELPKLDTLPFKPNSFLESPAFTPPQSSNISLPTGGFPYYRRAKTVIEQLQDKIEPTRELYKNEIQRNSDNYASLLTGNIDLVKSILSGQPEKWFELPNIPSTQTEQNAASEARDELIKTMAIAGSQIIIGLSPIGWYFDSANFISIMTLDETLFGERAESTTEKLLAGIGVVIPLMSINKAASAYKINAATKEILETSSRAHPIDKRLFDTIIDINTVNNAADVEKMIQSGKLILPGTVFSNFHSSIEKLESLGVHLNVDGIKFLAQYAKNSNHFFSDRILTSEELVEVGNQYNDLAKKLKQMNGVSEEVFVARALEEEIVVQGQVVKNTEDNVFKIAPGNLNSNHRYSQPGEEALYAATGKTKTEAWDTAIAEKDFLNQGQNLIIDEKSLVVRNMLDLTDENTLKQLNLTKADLILKSADPHQSKTSYQTTQIIGNLARQLGFDSLRVPSSIPSPDGKTNIILFTRKLSNE